ncbi:MAG: DegV family protein [Erysipelotrichaceae bacterium]|nr:DegV family protein [Erysipelotrichaceae bacterium]
MTVKIITDSGSDISQKRAQELGIQVIPLRFSFGEDEYLDGVTMSPKEFYERMDQEAELPKTSQITPYAYGEVFREAIADGSDVFYVSISSGVSGCFQSATLAATEFEGKVCVLDSKHFCSSEGLLAEYAKRLANEGKSLDEIYKLTEKAREKVRIIAVFATLENLRKGGRISATSAFVGEALNIKLLITIEDGGVGVLGKLRGMKKGYQAMRDYILKEGGIDPEMPCAFAYSGSDDSNISEFIEMNKDLYPDKEIPISYVGATVGTYSGAGAIATAYFVK